MRKPKKRYLTQELCGNIPLKQLMKPIRPPGTASGNIATSHYGKIFTIEFQVYLYEGGKGHAVFKYKIPKGDISYAYDETFDLEGRESNLKAGGWRWVYICKCKRRTRILFMGWDNAILCRYCLGVNTEVRQQSGWANALVAQDPTALSHLIRVAYTPYKKLRVIKIYADFLRRMIKAIKSRNAGAYLRHIKR